MFFCIIGNCEISYYTKSLDIDFTEDKTLKKSEKVNNLYEYMILVKSENDCEYGEIRPAISAYENFINFTPALFLKKENKAEYENVKHQLLV